MYFQSKAQRHLQYKGFVCVCVCVCVWEGGGGGGGGGGVNNEKFGLCGKALL